MKQIYAYCLLINGALGAAALLPSRNTDDLQACGDAFYHPSQYTCYETDFLCPILNGTATLKCGEDCYLQSMYSCDNDHLVYPPSSSAASSTGSAASCTSSPTTLQMSSPPYDNYFYSDCNSVSQVVITSPLEDSNLTLIGPRFLVAWPAGNSGLVSYFAPQNQINGTLSIQLQKSSIGNPLGPIYETSGDSNATVGVTGQVEFNSSAVLTVAILGSIRTIRDFVEGASILRPEIQDAIVYESLDNGGAVLSRLWLDNITTTTLSFEPTSSDQTITVENTTLLFDPGLYTFNASFNYPQLTQLSAEEVLSADAASLITQEPEQTKALSFLSYSSKLTAGAWRFLTYFGRDSMISALLLQPVLSEGEGSAMEAVISAVLERLNSTDGSVCHEETIGDYATWLNLQDNITSTAGSCTYPMVDTDFYLPVLLELYFVKSSTGISRRDAFLNTTATLFPWNANLSYSDLALLSAERIMALTASFATNQTIENLVHLKSDEIVGEWRDSTYGIGGGRIPYDVNTALAPAALRSIASLSRAGFFPSHPSWNSTADAYAQIWEDHTLEFFEVSVSETEAKDLLNNYTMSSFNGSSQIDTLDSTGVTFHALALNGYDNLAQVAVMNSDDCFRHFLLNTTNQTQLTRFINSTANNVRRRFPAGLMTDVSMLVANPAYGDADVYAANWTTSAYHGTVVWSWPLAMMAAGLEVQLARCDGSSSAPDFCADESVYENVVTAYNALWDSIEANSEHLTSEVWSWVYESDEFTYIDLGALPPAPGTSPTESDIVQLWSLTFLAVTRNSSYQ